MVKFTTVLFGFFLTIQAACADDFILTSPEVKSGKRVNEQQVFNGFGCTGENISPELEWKNPPSGTKSFAVTMYDPDAPTGSGWWHWVVFNIPANVTGLANGASNDAQKLPAGSIEGRTDYGKPGYGGPCPPQGNGSHRYQISVHALKTDKLPLDENVPAAMVGFYLHQNLIEKTTLQALYSR